MSEAKYRLRFFFDTGSGTGLWSSNAAAHERFGYAITLQHLPVTQNTWRRALYLCQWYDTSLDWENPGEPSP